MMHRLPFTLEKQAAPVLCWAAIGASLVRYYCPDQKMDQHGAVIAVLGHYRCVPFSAPLALKRLGVLRLSYNRALSPKEICTELTSRRIIVLRHGSQVGASHLLALSGYDTDGRLWLDDPSGGGGWHTYEEVLGAPRLWYEWQGTYLTGPSLNG